MADDPYNKREMDTLLKNLHTKLDRIETVGKETRTETQKTNGRVNKLERNLQIVAAITATMLVMSGSQVVEVIKAFI